MRVSIDESGQSHQIEADAVEGFIPGIEFMLTGNSRVGPTQTIRSARMRIAPFSMMPRSDIERRKGAGRLLRAR